MAKAGLPKVTQECQSGVASEAFFAEDLIRTCERSEIGGKACYE